MKPFLIPSVLALAALAVLGAASLAHAQLSGRTLEFGLQDPKGHPLEQGASKFAELVAAKSGGKIKVNAFPSGALGDAPTVSALQGGTVEVTALNANPTPMAFPEVYAGLEISADEKKTMQDSAVEAGRCQRRVNRDAAAIAATVAELQAELATLCK
jgi:TRAP-type C4-dicarboxylate transport system substrate-binding protein